MKVAPKVIKASPKHVGKLQKLEARWAQESFLATKNQFWKQILSISHLFQWGWLKTSALKPEIQEKWGTGREFCTFPLTLLPSSQGLRHAGVNRRGGRCPRAPCSRRIAGILSPRKGPRFLQFFTGGCLGESRELCFHCKQCLPIAQLQLCSHLESNRTKRWPARQGLFHALGRLVLSSHRLTRPARERIGQACKAMFLHLLSPAAISPEPLRFGAQLLKLICGADSANQVLLGDYC